jgi:hypothetical protein
MGLGTLLQVACLPFWSRARWRDPTWRCRVVGLAIAGVAALVLAPGPGGLFGGRFNLHDVLAAWLPGFAGLRYTYRFGVLASFATSALAGLAFAEGLQRAGAGDIPRRLPAIVVTVAVALQAPAAVRISPNVTAIPTGDAVPQVYRWLAANGGGAPFWSFPSATRTRRSRRSRCTTASTTGRPC